MTAPGLTVTAIPVPEYNFRAQDGKVRGVDQVECSSDGTVTVTYIDDYVEKYPATNVQEVTTHPPSDRYYR